MSPRVWMLLFLAVVSGSAQALRAECLGCPPGAWHVEIQMKGGELRRGYLNFHPLWAQDILERETRSEGALWKDDLRNKRGLEEFRIWDRLEGVDPIFEGRCGSRGEGEPVFEDCTFRLPKGTGFLVGEGELVALDDVERIADLSTPGADFEMSYPAVRVRADSFQHLAHAPVDALRYWNGSNDVYCFGFSLELSNQRLEDLCVDDSHGGMPASTDAPPFVYESSQVLIVADDPGT